MFVIRLAFSKFACVILVRWCVTSIACKMTHELYLRVTHKNQWTTCQYGARKCQVKIELYCTYTYIRIGIQYNRLG